MIDIIEVDAATGRAVARAFTSEEAAQYEADQIAAAAALAEQEQAAEAKATARTALLSRLGITEDEARLLLG